MTSAVPPVWHALSLSPDKLITARQELHWAAQVVASVGATLLPRRAEYAHADLIWASPNRLQSHEIKPGKTFRGVLDLEHFQLHLEGHGHKGYEDVSSFRLAGHKLDAAYDWMTQALQDYQGKLEQPLYRLANLPWSLPQHPMQMGAIFMAPNRIFREIALWFDNAHGILQEVAAQHKMNATHVVCRPSTFDLNFRFEQAIRSLGVGFSPGNEVKSEPFFYLSPWPAPGPKEKLPELPFGHWEREGWVGAVLTASDILKYTDAASQQAVVRRFFAEAIPDLHWFERG